MDGGGSGLQRSRETKHCTIQKWLRMDTKVSRSGDGERYLAQLSCLILVVAPKASVVFVAPESRHIIMNTRDWKLRGMLFATASSCARFIHLSIGLCERGFTMDKFIIGVGAINKILKSKKLQWTLLVFQYHFNKIQVPYMFEMSIS
ncbi:hypothetical protein JHK87_010298 [Glycine soja]|nr:hypothetical protein JHK87_010298 [Glycine soja]